jgi:hypothetical protein
MSVGPLAAVVIVPVVVAMFVNTPVDGVVAPIVVLFIVLFVILRPDWLGLTVAKNGLPWPINVLKDPSKLK